MSPPIGRWAFGKPFRYDAELEALLALRDAAPQRWSQHYPMKARIPHEGDV